MRKLNWHIFLFLIFSFANANAQFSTFQRTIGTPSHDFGYGIRTSDNGMAFIFTSGPYQPTSEAVLVKTDSLGNTVWARTYSSTTDPVDVGGIIELNGGGFLIWLHIWSTNVSVALVNVDASGNIVWIKPGSFTSGFQNSTGGFTTFTASCINWFDNQGNYLSTKHYGGVNEFSPWSGKRTSDGGCIMYGSNSTYSSGGGNDFDGFAVRTDSVGNLLWAKVIGTDSAEMFINADQTFDGGFIFIGKSKISGNSGDYDAWLVKVDANGNLQWSKNYGGASGDFGVYVRASTGLPGYILAGQTIGNETLYPGMRSFVYRTDINGNFQWGRIYGDVTNGSPAEDAIDYADFTLEGGYIFTGHTGTFGAGMNDVWCIRTDNNGVSGCNEISTVPSVTIPVLNVTNVTAFNNYTVNYPALQSFNVTANNYVEQILCSNVIGLGIEDVFSDESISVFPNPSSGIVNVSFKKLAKNSKITIYNSLGQTVYSSKIESNSFTIDLSTHSSGIYLVNITDDRSVISRKIIKE